MTKKYNISKPEKYIKDGQEKTYWTSVGTMTEFIKQDGSISRILEIPAIGLKANIFEMIPKVEQKPIPAKYPIENSGSIELPTEEVNPDEIPF